MILDIQNIFESLYSLHISIYFLSFQGHLPGDHSSTFLSASSSFLFFFNTPLCPQNLEAKYHMRLDFFCIIYALRKLKDFRISRIYHFVS